MSLLNNDMTIKELNEKWWYRLTKVVYFVFLILLIVGFVIMIINENKKEFLSNSSYINCNDGRRINIDSLPLLYRYYGDGNLLPSDEVKFRELCEFDPWIAKEMGYTNEDVINFLRKNNRHWILKFNDILYTFDEALAVFGEDVVINNIANSRVIPMENNFTTQFSYEPRNWNKTIGYSLISIVACLLSFEIIRRIFYYVVVGKIVPKE